MKLSAANVEGFIRAPDPAVRAMLLYGPDGGLVRERADALARQVVDDLGDPFRVAELGPAQLKADPARLADEAAAAIEAVAADDAEAQVREAARAALAMLRQGG